MKVEEGDTIKIEYEGTLENGDVFDSSEKQGKPIEFEVGAKKVIPGLDKAVVGMEEGDEKEIKIEPGDAYGERKEKLVKKVPKDQLPEGKEPKKGMMLAVNLPNGSQVPAKIVEIGDKDITLDLNHPLAGKTLNFKVKVVNVKKGSAEEDEE